MKQLSILFSFFLLFALIIMEKPLYGQLISAGLTLPSPTTRSDGKKYYCASRNGGTSYNFDVSASDPSAAAQTDYDYFRITIPTSSGNLVLNWDADASGEGTYIELSGAPSTSVTLNPTPPTNTSGNWTNPVIRFTLIFNWTVPSTSNSPRNIIAEVKESGAPTTRTSTQSQSYGIASNIKVYNFTQSGGSGDADDGYINTSHGIFNVSGTVVYDLEGYNLENATDALADAEINTVTLQLIRTTLVSVFTSFATGGTAAFTQVIPALTVNTVLANGYFWRVSVNFSGTGADETSPASNGIPLECNNIQVTSIQFINGIGRGPTHSSPDNISSYYRAYGLPGTLIQISSQMEVNAGSGQAMHGDTDFTVEYNDGTNTGTFTCTISSGSNSGSTPVEYDNASGFLNAWITDGQTANWTYQVNGISGSDHGDQATGDGNASAITSSIYWDQNDPPSSGSPAISFMRIAPSATSLTIYWVPLDTRTTATTFDEDFYEYRIYFKESSSSNFLLWDGDDDSSLRDLSNNPYPGPTSDSTLHFDSNGWKYTSIPNLNIFTSYEFYISAVDVFGNEISQSNAAPESANRTIRTQPFSIEIEISDGINQYSNESFADLNPEIRPLRETNIRVDVTIVTSETLPETIRVWYTTGDIETSPNIVTASNTINETSFPENTLSYAETERLAPNIWTAHISSQSTAIQLGNNIRFIVETILNGISAYSDSEIEPYPNENPNDDEWTFSIVIPTNFRPWPVRILNNVITKKNPVAYPSYYLSDNSYVTIRVYDIKGRQVATLLDKASRNGGQNIKEQGWRGTNMASKKLGVGLYYIHFKAKRKTDGKIILNKFKKIVIAK